tara:strand:+ start:126 stop:638 length:513 start_codon:yes stop_codon:yes gene_type:complete
MDEFRDRIIEVREGVKASSLLPHPANDKIHGNDQQAALRAAMRRRGVTAVVYAVERDGKLLLVDGHLRREMIQAGSVRVAVLDLTDEEVLEELIAHDQIASLAEIDNSQRLRNVEALPLEAVESLGLTEEAVEELRGEPPNIDFPEYDENIDLSGVQTANCPECGHEFPV